MQETTRSKRKDLGNRLRKSPSQDALDLKEYFRLYKEELKDKLLKVGEDGLVKAQAEAQLVDRIYKELTVTPPLENGENSVG